MWDAGLAHILLARKVIQSLRFLLCAINFFLEMWMGCLKTKKVLQCLSKTF